jgi:hypothetical protein
MLHYIRVTDGIINCYLDEFGIKGLRTRGNLFTIHHCDFIAQQLTTGTTVYLYIEILAIIRAFLSAISHVLSINSISLPLEH